MSFKKLNALGAQILNDLVPLLHLTVCLGIRLVLNLFERATKGGKVTAGTPSPSNPLAVTDRVQLYFGDPRIKEAEVIVDWSGLQPGSVGVYQINARVPGAHVKGDSLPVTLRIGGVDSPTTGATAAVVYVN